jgi:hypothetical protein
MHATAESGTFAGRDGFYPDDMEEAMSTSKQPKPAKPSDADLKGNPGIGSSKGTGRNDERLEGENTFEGDVLNDTTRHGGVDPRQTGRTNR